jgi:hypothetical protein
MIQVLLSKYRNWLGFEHQESENYRMNQALDMAHQRKYADFLLRFVVAGWLCFQLYTYHQMALRPAELFEPINWFDKLFMPSFPNIYVWYFVWLSAFLANLSLIFRGENFFGRVLLGALILYINCIRWKYEFFSHVGHLIVLYHLLGALLPRQNSFGKNQETIDYSSAIKWLNFGVLVTYTMAGLWKVVGLFYKMIFKPDELNWLNPLAMKVNSIIGYRDWDRDLDAVETLYSVPILWQIAFLLMLYIQTSSIFGVLRPQLAVYYAIGNIAFHLINAFLIHIEFYISPLILFVMFFPYHWIFKNSQTEKFTAEFSGNEYKRIYSDGTTDCYTGFYAFREQKYDKNSFWWAWLYLPVFSTVFGILYKVIKK